jgi:peptide deformylase
MFLKAGARQMNGYTLANQSSNVLKRVAEPVTPEENVTEIILAMCRIMKAGGGIGLAANQIGVLKRIICLDCAGLKVTVINPVLTNHSGSIRFTEGCLSYPDKFKIVRRSKRVTLQGLDEEFKPVRYVLSGLQAACAQHEVDHLNGRTIG